MTPDIFEALANPIRRQLLAHLRQGPRPVKQLAAPFDLGRPAISAHLRILREAGLVYEEWRGRENFYHLDPRPLSTVRDWLAEYDTFWSDKLNNLSHLLDEDNP